MAAQASAPTSVVAVARAPGHAAAAYAPYATRSAAAATAAPITSSTNGADVVAKATLPPAPPSVRAALSGR